MLFLECTLQAASAPQASVQSAIEALFDELRAVARLEWGCRRTMNSRFTYGNICYCTGWSN